MRIAVIVAMARNRVIGRDNRLPWHLPADLKQFRALTLGKPVIMGRCTFESIGKPLPGRTNIVVTRSAHFTVPAPAIAVADLVGALALARDVARRDSVDECFVIGGAQLYAACMPLADRIYLTRIEAEIEGDRWFPQWNESEWHEVARVPGGIDVDSGLRYSYAVLERQDVRREAE